MKCRELGMIDRLRKFADIIEGSEDRMLTQEEYKYVKEFPLYDDVREFWRNHLTPEGYNDYCIAPSQGRYGKWKVYQDIYKRTHTKLFKALK